ncbi:Sec8 exocyst complex component-specific domain-containing protein [Dipodascopsis tothii]|uniref:Sec8 exocyst complex component-specific domain-containing protein n=1 Tax=Dipodascopsis tothii TaxID=44089 RepID=UPI0034CF84D7
MVRPRQAPLTPEHYGDSARSLDKYREVMQSISESDASVSAIKQDLVKAKANLTSKQPQMRGLAVSSARYRDMLKILDDLENLQAIPDKLDQAASDKRFHTAVTLLQEGLRLAKRSDLAEIMAVEFIRQYLRSQESSLAETLTEELHDHLYMKSPYCDYRWQSFEAAPGDRAEDFTLIESSVIAHAANDSISLIEDFAKAYDPTTDVADDPTTNPEADSFGYMRCLLESLHRLGKLASALATVSQRLPTEVYKLVEMAITEVDMRSSAVARTGYAESVMSGRVLDDKDKVSQEHAISIKDLSQKIFPRLEAILQGQQLVHVVVQGIASRRDGPKLHGRPLEYNYEDAWKTVQHEVQNILHDYVTDNVKAEMSLTEARAHAKGILASKAREKGKTKILFKLANADPARLVSYKDLVPAKP